MSQSDKRKTVWDTIADKLREWRDAVDEALTPQPELVPVPVPSKGRRRR
jgi:hypothetical protein